jgi:hypothetical protein
LAWPWLALPCRVPLVYGFYFCPRPAQHEPPWRTELYRVRVPGAPCQTRMGTVQASVQASVGPAVLVSAQGHVSMTSHGGLSRTGSVWPVREDAERVGWLPCRVPYRMHGHCAGSCRPFQGVSLAAWDVAVSA